MRHHRNSDGLKSPNVCIGYGPVVSCLQVHVSSARDSRSFRLISFPLEVVGSTST